MKDLYRQKIGGQHLNSEFIQWAFRQNAQFAHPISICGGLNVMQKVQVNIFCYSSNKFTLLSYTVIQTETSLIC